MGSICIVLVGAVIAATETWQALSVGDVAILALSAVFVAIATYLMTLAFRNVDVSVVAPFRYSYLLTSIVAGYFLFSELPDGWSAAGAVLIVGSGLYTLHREAVRRRQLTGTANTAL
jgi:drug/metabolite transporter (DMT)-like permease